MQALKRHQGKNYTYHELVGFQTLNISHRRIRQNNKIIYIEKYP